MSCGPQKKESFPNLRAPSACRLGARSWRRELALQLALPCGQALQRPGHGIKCALEAIHAIEKWLRIKSPLSLELADPIAGAPPCDAEAEGTDSQNLGGHEQRAEKKARRIHVPLLDVWGPNESRLRCGALRKIHSPIYAPPRLEGLSLRRSNRRITDPKARIVQVRRVVELSGLQGPGDLVRTEDDAGWRCLRADELE